MRFYGILCTLVPVVVWSFGYMEEEKTKKRALLTVDVQDCFLDYSTTLPVSDSSRIIPVLNELRSEPTSNYFDLFIRSQDFHPAGHLSFGPTHGLPGFYNYPFGIKVACTNAESEWGCCPMLHESYCPEESDCPQASDLTNPDLNPACATCFPSGNATSLEVSDACKIIDQAMWPIHCTDPDDGGDAGFAADLIVREDDVIMKKGTLVALDAYSVFQDNAFFSLRGGLAAGYEFELAALLEEYEIDEFYVSGLATDFCVAWSAKDASALGYEVYLIDDAAAGIAEETVLSEYALMEAANVTLLETFGGDQLEYGGRRLSHDRAKAINNARILSEAGIKRITLDQIRKQMASA